MIDVTVAPRADGRYDIKAERQSEPLANSSQGYENVEDATSTARKLFGNAAGRKLRFISAILHDEATPELSTSALMAALRDILEREDDGSEEHIDLIVKFRDGTARTEPIR